MDFESKVGGVLEAGINSLRDIRHWSEGDPENNNKTQIFANPKFHIQATLNVDKEGMLDTLI